MAKKSMILLALAALLPSAIFAYLPNDPEATQWSYADTKVFEAWDLATGSRDVVVAIIDNGFDTFHPELVHNVWINDDEIPGNGIDDDNNGYIDDVWGWNFVGEDLDGNVGLSEEEMKGNNDPRPSVLNLTPAEIADGSLHHGTLVAGIIGARANNNQFGAGINWDVRLMNLKVVGNSGNIAIARIAEAIRYAADNGADIINISLVGPAEQQDLKDSVRYAYEKGVTIIAAAGNDYLSLDMYPRYPICADEEGDTTDEWVLGVSAVNEEHALAQFSNRGRCIDIAAPGVHISSTLRYAPRYGLEKLYGGRFSGTSFAAPFVAGTAALIKSIHPEWGPKQIFETILKNVHKTPPQNENEYHRYFGAGLVQIDRAVRSALAEVIGFHALGSVVSYALSRGLVQEDRRETSAPAVAKAGVPRGAKALAFFRVRDRFEAVGIFAKNRTRDEVVFFDDAWRVTRRWEIPASSLFSLAVGDIAEDNAPELVIAPRAGSRTVFRVYALDGKELRAETTAKAHTGAHIGLVENKHKKRMEIIAVYGGRLYRYDDRFEVVKTIDLPHVRGSAPVGAGDIDGDGRQEYVIGSGPGDEPKLAYYEEDGRWLRTFYAYDPGVLGGLALVVGDYDMDGKDDVVVAVANSGQPVRVWTDRSKRIAEWFPFGAGSRESMILVGRYK